jgi:hypothetical protein
MMEKRYARLIFQARLRRQWRFNSFDAFVLKNSQDFIFTHSDTMSRVTWMTIKNDVLFSHALLICNSLGLSAKIASEIDINVVKYN